ncbi:hypothetical protein JCM10212_001825, partial [Sporobolomyces blumeae]
TDSEDDKPPTLPKPTYVKPGAAPTAKEESSEYETDSEEESEDEPLKPIYKPVFVSKRNRDTIAEREKELDPEVVEAKRNAEIEKQKEQSKNLVAESIVRELAEKEVEQVQPDVDDTDGLDPEGEFEEWKLRELMRIKRDKEARYALEKIREEVEARRSMPEHLRLKEDTERAEKSRKDKKKGSQVFMQKYHHKGAFHQDQEILKKHDYTAPTESTVDVSALPAVLQRRNFGKASQSKYTHLADQDTSRRDGGFGTGRTGTGGAGGGAGCFNCGGPHLKRDCPQLNDPSLAGPSGSNASASTRRDEGWGARRRPDDDNDDRVRSAGREGDRDRDRGSGDRFAASRDGPIGSGGGTGRRGGVGYDRRGGGSGRDDRDGERDWRDRGRDGRSSYGRDRDRDERDRSRSPPSRRDRDPDYGGGRSGGGDSRYSTDRGDRDRRRDDDRSGRRDPRDRDFERDSERRGERDRGSDRYGRSGGEKRRDGSVERDDRDKRRRVE